MEEKSEKSKAYEEYMARVGHESIPCYEPTMGKQEIEFLTDLVERNWLSEGKYVREFEERLAKSCERKYALAFCNATSALISGMKSHGIGPGDEVIVPSFTHPADPNSISVTGATPAFAEVDEETLCLSAETIDEARTKRTKAILFVSVYGNVGKMEEVVKYAKDNDLVLINDCAPALFGSYKGRAIASFGDFSVLSFFADKTITTGEGGMLLTDDPGLIEECNIYKHDGRRERGHDLIERRGYNFRITEMQAAIGVAQLNKAHKFVARKKEILKQFTSSLDGIPGVSVFRFNPEGDICPHRIMIQVPEARPLLDHLGTLGIGVRTMFMPMHSQPCYGVKKEFPVTEKLFTTGVCLPSAPTLTDDNIQFISNAIRDFYQ